MRVVVESWMIEAAEHFIYPNETLEEDVPW